MFVLVLQVVHDIKFGEFLQKLGPMEVAGSFTPIDGNLWVSGPVNNPDGIPIGLRTIGHEAFEVRLGNTMAGHDMVEAMLEKYLSILIFGMDVAGCDDHDALVGSIVNVAGHGGPLGDAFDMVGHDPSVLDVPARLHAFNQVHPTTRATSNILKTRTLSLSSPCPGN